MKYYIHKKHHYSNFGLQCLIPKIHFGVRQLKFKMILDSECWWFGPRNTDDYDINKIYGISYGHHHTNSLRIGWVPDFNSTSTIKLYGYWYQNKIRNFQYLCDVLTDFEYDIKINVYENNTYIYVNDNKLIIDFHLPDKFLCGYYLYPYFGGNNKSPNNMMINIKKI